MEMIRHKKLLVMFIMILGTEQLVKCDGIIEVFQWKQMDFYNRGSDGNSAVGSGSGMRPTKSKPTGSIVFPDQLDNKRPYRTKRSPAVITSRDEPIKTNPRWSGDNVASTNTSYIPYNNIPMGATHYNGRLFITLPRRRTGVPSTLNYIDMHKDGRNPSPKLYAYPDFETNQFNENFQPNPNRLISVYRTSVDACKRLWFIDTGMLEYPDNRIQVQRPSIWVIDLRNDRVIRRFEIPQRVAETGRGLASITVDITRMNCNAAFAYIPDLLNSQLSVYSFEQNRIWTFSHNYFNFDPLGGDLNVGGQSFRWDDGIFSATIGAINANGFKNVYFHAMASTNEFMVSNEVLQNEANTMRSDHGNDFQLLGNRGTNHQSTMHEYDPSTGIIFYDEIQQNGVGCWNSNKPFSADNHGTVAQDPQRMIYPSDLTIDEQGTIWVMSNSLPIFIYSELDPNVVNFRVWKQNVVQAAKNTVCE